MHAIEKNLHAVRQQIQECEKQFQRQTQSIKLLAVSKNQSIEKIRAALAAGQHCFGENYLQEALEKITTLADENIEWHYLGAIQSNKIRRIAANFAWVQTVADFKTAQRLHELRPLKAPVLNICLQVNISHETSKAGAMSEDIFQLAEQCEQLTRLKVRGLMAIPAAKREFAAQCIAFHEMKMLFEKGLLAGFKWDVLSQGMSQDLAAAIAEGSTMVRIGTKIFGSREQI